MGGDFKNSREESGETYLQDSTFEEPSTDYGELREIGTRRHAEGKHAVIRARGRGFMLLASIFGVLALFVSLIAAVRAFTPRIKVLDVCSARVWAYMALTCAALTIVAVVGSHAEAKVHRAGSLARKGFGSIAMALLAAVVSFGALQLNAIAPNGIWKEPVRDAAPASSQQEMEKGLEQVSGSCTSGWQDMNNGSYPGVGYIEVCESNRTAFITFDSKASAMMYRAPAKAKIAQELSEHASDERAQGNWRLLNGELWMAFGDKGSMRKLQKLWGGSIGVIDTDGSDK